jgi:ribosomal protein S18 acetylase RimI-like enzyme
MLNFVIRRAVMSDLANVAELFDQYRQFYGQPGNMSMAKVFMSVRLKQGDAVIFVAEALIDGSQHLVGFLQLIPSFSSIAARPIWILNDAYVRSEWRGEGVGKALLAHAQDFARQSGVKRLVLETSEGNTLAQKLYEEMNFTRVQGMVQYVYDI